MAGEKIHWRVLIIQHVADQDGTRDAIVGDSHKVVVCSPIDFPCSRYTLHTNRVNLTNVGEHELVVDDSDGAAQVNVDVLATVMGPSNEDALVNGDANVGKVAQFEALGRVTLEFVSQHASDATFDGLVRK
eukprot:1249993-Rhodomonas_salina.1